MRKVLFVCVHNSGRSQMAEAWLNHLCNERFLAESAGITPARAVNPQVVKVMQESDIDISGKIPRSVFDVYKSGEMFSYIVTVCDQASAEQCPVFLGLIKQLHWSFPDPSKITGTEDEILEGVRRIRDSIRDKILSWCGEVTEAEDPL
ncbi:MAG: arsenate reductase ArsC [Desulfomonilia bacterium]|jgi:arsenate reductase